MLEAFQAGNEDRNELPQYQREYEENESRSESEQSGYFC
jgi:hypothetical protein